MIDRQQQQREKRRQWLWITLSCIACVVNSLSIILLAASLSRCDWHVGENFDAITRLQQRMKHLEERVYYLESHEKDTE